MAKKAKPPAESPAEPAESTDAAEPGTVTQRLFRDLVAKARAVVAYRDLESLLLYFDAILRPRVEDDFRAMVDELDQRKGGR